MASLVNQNGFRNYTPSVVHGPMYSKDYDSDGSLWIPAIGGDVQTFVGTFTKTRHAAGDYYLALTAAANSPFAVVNLSQIFDKIGTDPIWAMTQWANSMTNYPTIAAGNPPYTAAALGVGPIKVSDDFEGHIIRGIMLTGYDVVYALTTANLTSFAGTCYETTYNATETAGSVTTTDASQSLGVATATDLVIGNVKIAVPFVIGGNASVEGTTVIADYLELAIVNPGTSVLNLYGVRLYFDYCLN